MTMQERPDTCTICQLSAFGYNYSVVSCNACKMFFRRCMMEKVPTKCQRIGKCFDGEDLAETRPRCRPCRYKKCVQMGMRIASSEECSSDDRTSRSSSSSSPGAILPRDLVVQEQNDCLLIGYLSYLNKTRQDVYSVINICVDPSFYDLVVQGSMLGDYARPRTILWESTERKLKPWGSLGVLVVVEVCKTLDFYNELLLSDRVLLLRNVAFKSHHLSIAFDSYLLKKERVFAPQGLEMFPLELLKSSKCRKVIMELLTSPMEPLIGLGLSEKEFLLLNMIIICNPGIPGLSPGGQKSLSEHREKFAKILLKICLIKDGNSGPSRFADIIAINQKLDRQVFITQKLDYALRLHWEPTYYFPNVLYEACRMSNCKWLKVRH